MPLNGGIYEVGISLLPLPTLQCITHACPTLNNVIPILMPLSTTWSVCCLQSLAANWRNLVSESPHQWGRRWSTWSCVYNGEGRLLDQLSSDYCDRFSCITTSGESHVYLSKGPSVSILLFRIYMPSCSSLVWCNKCNSVGYVRVAVEIIQDCNQSNIRWQTIVQLSATYIFI